MENKTGLCPLFVCFEGQIKSTKPYIRIGHKHKNGCSQLEQKEHVVKLSCFRETGSTLIVQESPITKTLNYEYYVK